jgi:hypothetical protein
MSRNNTVTIWCTILEERELALRVEQVQARDNKLRAWLPRSQLHHLSKRKQPMETKIEMPEWLALDKGFDYE